MRRLGAALVAISLGTAPVAAAQAGGFSTNDIRIMALNMYHEARGEGRLGMLAVGWVVLNRMADKAYPDTVRGVIYQGCQFSWVCDDISDRPRDQKAWRRAVKPAADLLRRPRFDPTLGAMWYHAGWVRDPGFGPRVAEVRRIGRHVFYGRATPTADPRAKIPLCQPLRRHRDTDGYDLSARARSYRIAVLDRNRGQRVGRRDAEHPAEEGVLGQQRRLDRLRLAEAVALAGEGEIGHRHALGPQRRDHGLGLVRRHHLVVLRPAGRSPGSSAGRCGGSASARDRSAARLGPGADQPVEIAALELVGVAHQGLEVADAVPGRPGLEAVVEGQRAQRGEAAGTAAADRQAFRIGAAGGGEMAGGGDAVLDVERCPICPSSRLR